MAPDSTGNSSSKWGTYSEDDLKRLLWGFSPTLDGSKERNLITKSVQFRSPESLTRFLDGLAALIKEPSMTYRQKADEFLEWATREEYAARYFRELWQQLADGRPYPLDEQGSSPGTPPDEQKK